jgi:DNA-directed RNA polymerase specialized sigma24 family protein
MRLCVALRQGQEVDHLGAWLRATMRHILADGARRPRRCGPELRDPEEDVLGDWPDPHASANPATAAMLHDYWAQAPSLFRRLQPPYRQIATLQYLQGWTRRGISQWLRTWRPVGEEEVRRLLSRTHSLLRSVACTTSGMRVQQSAGDRTPKKNPWLTTPPPPGPTTTG